LDTVWLLPNFLIAPLEGEAAVLKELLLPGVVLSRLDSQFVSQIRHADALDEMPSNDGHLVLWTE
jgi:hypothetical protein